MHHVGKGEGIVWHRKDTHLSPRSMGSPKVMPRWSYISWFWRWMYCTTESTVWKKKVFFIAWWVSLVPRSRLAFHAMESWAGPGNEAMVSDTSTNQQEWCSFYGLPPISGEQDKLLTTWQAGEWYTRLVYHWTVLNCLGMNTARTLLENTLSSHGEFC